MSEKMHVKDVCWYSNCFGPPGSKKRLTECHKIVDCTFARLETDRQAVPNPPGRYYRAS